ncbi:D-2-hydroxyacid dehydrogenase family protein [Bifidobacterium choloepi]|uniref:D-2-hydroxyacid dehydrogenase family protein n=1 Tax=Bifidobacterium choloepi TaxID=2614131 RepID=A0A6I5N212_9BIFI|nr:D-2-hydroxyacid dehydrogenase family protein [Bifidobacterium choloepi]NEG69669.1 D-2-hydroxyacid dehydrogenase family protein [Bifidobacterium choloepi]
MTVIYETQQDRTDLPLVVMPCVMKGMIEPFKQWFGMLDGVARLKMYEDFTYDEDEFVKRCAGAEAVIVIGFHISDNVLRQLSGHVKCFAFGGTGVASFIDLDEAKRLGIRICNVVHYGDHAVAEFAVALMFELARHVGELNRETHEGVWDTQTHAGMELCGKTLGIVGLGGIGQTVARIAQGIGMKVTAWKSPTSKKDYAALGVTPIEDLSRLMATADVVSINLPLLPGTKGIVKKEHIDAMRPGTMFINTARAELVEPGALLDRLEKGDIVAGLDVYYQEPLPADSPLLKLGNVVLTPHVAWRSDGAYTSLTKQVIESIAAYFKGDRFNVVVG